MNTTHLQGIGTVNAKPAAELVPGDITMWNFGYTQEVLAVEELSPKFVRLVMKGSSDPTKTVYRRTMKTFLVGVMSDEGKARRAKLLAGARADLDRLIAAKAAGWSVTDAEMARAEGYVKAFS